MIFILCTVLGIIIGYILSDEYCEGEGAFWGLVIGAIGGLVSSFILLNDTYETITNTTPIVSLNDGSYNKINGGGFIFTHINSENKTVYRYIMKIGEDEYKQYFLEGDVSIKEIKDITTGVINTIGKKTKDTYRYTPERLLNNQSVLKYQIVVPKGSVIKEFTVDNQ